MVSLVRKLIANRNLLKNLILRDLKQRYVGSFGGFLWSVINPIVTLVSYILVFGIILGMKVGKETGTTSFGIFLFCGYLPWLLFSDTVVRNCSVIPDNAPLITKTVIPAEILSISVTISNLVHHLIGLSILLIVLTRFTSIHLSAAWTLLYMLILVLFAQGLGWIAATLHVFLRDTIQALQILMMLWLYFTPIFYPPSMVDRAPKTIRFLAGLNPMGIIVTGYRDALLNQAQPGGMQVGGVMALSLVVFVFGAFLFRQAKPAFADVL
ncbi:MAG TPA: ABC transporter permease [Terriglobia bacterium]|jgi:ABC-type polysaccharide/polyol phosphate export permease